MAAVLKVNEAYKSFNNVQALNNADFFLCGGEWLGLLGPNGAGKTTCVRAITGRVLLDRGNLTLNDVVLDQSSKASQARKHLGVVSQEIALYPMLTAIENLKVWGTFHELPKKTLAQKTEWALEWSSLQERSREPIKYFSGGMKRRLNIACSVLHDPQLIILDEPTVGVDPQSRQRIWMMLRELHDKGASLLLTTHQMEEAQHLCQRIVIIDNGKVIANGSFDELVGNTIGHQRRVCLRLDRELETSCLSRIGAEKSEKNSLCCKMNNVAKELPEFLKIISATGAEVLELSIDAPSLQEVFISLTGRELRQ